MLQTKSIPIFSFDLYTVDQIETIQYWIETKDISKFGILLTTLGIIYKDSDVYDFFNKIDINNMEKEVEDFINHQLQTQSFNSIFNS